MNKLQVAADLTAAADYIDRVGWSCGQGRRGERVCAAVAITDCVPEAERSNRNGSRYREAAAALAAFVGYASVPIWNDQLTRSQEQVTGAMRQLAANLREQAAVDAYETPVGEEVAVG